MRLARHNIIGFVLSICVWMQVVALIPHHHHGDGEGVCLNYTHLYDTHDACNDACTGGHEHDEQQPAASCNSFGIVIVQPERQETETVVPVAPANDSHDDIFILIQNSLLTEHCTDIAAQSISHIPDTQPLVSRCVSPVRLARAPGLA